MQRAIRSGECFWRSIVDIHTQILADAQVHLPVRLLVQDLARYGFPAVRYAIEMVAEQMGTNGE